MEEEWRKIKSNILHIAEDAVGKRTIFMLSSGRKKILWYIEFKETVKRKEKAFLKTKTTNSPEDRELYRQKKNMASGNSKNHTEND